MSGYKQSLDNGVLKNPKDVSARNKREGSISFPDLIVNGENDKGFTAVTPNGISRVSGDSLVYKDNYGRRENGSHSSWDFDF